MLSKPPKKIRDMSEAELDKYARVIAAAILTQHVGPQNAVAARLLDVD